MGHGFTYSVVVNRGPTLLVGYYTFLSAFVVERENGSPALDGGSKRCVSRPRVRVPKRVVIAINKLTQTTARDDLRLSGSCPLPSRLRAPQLHRIATLRLLHTAQPSQMYHAPLPSQ